MEQHCQEKIKELHEKNQEKEWGVPFARSNSFRASITPNKTNILISDKGENYFFK